ncbi:hypothetical protein IMCC3317_01110 [Kordia antarctica]|uniref:DUF3887 domain-containing protein n=1 Tax=Kordia antarctica TaxID=1218801 RepID=A0A7L4ZDP8_9FLAO|nr:hypothetical protein [Kordia antarctica]QHI34767.1 hypothetical protein IMCC3317_01110 [Kordia antarctica]
MKKTIYIPLLICISLVYNACNSNASADEPIGKHTFELLQKLDTISSADFGNYFISLEELREFVKDTTIEENFRNAMTKMSKEKYKKGLLQSYEMLKESGERQQINWANITYEEYAFQLRLDNGVTFNDGYLLFTHNAKKYMAKVVSFEYEEKQRLFILSNFELAQ